MALKAPKEEGKHTLEVSVIDRLGNKTKRPVKATFQVQIKPKADPNVANNKPRPALHILKVKVKIAGEPLSANQKPELTIAPEAGAPERIGNVFVYRGLKGGVEYTVTGIYELTRPGFKKAITKGEIFYTFDKDERGEITKPITLNLERE